ncbi:MAG TPA: hypothetical protein DCP79_04050 [Prevotella sp.]|nr:hypothetical protein [Prevotella sp.]
MIKNEQIDKELQKAGVKFLPFVGDQYSYGISFNDNGELVLGTEAKPGKKVLVLGESHYCDEDLSDEELSSFTREVLDCYLKSEERYSWMRTFLKFERALSNADTNIDSKSIWNHLMFYNYLQCPLRGLRMAGDSRRYEDATTPFFAILKKYKPDYIIVWGRRLFVNLPSENVQEGEYMPSIEINIWSYQIDGHTIMVLPVVHPSGGFLWGYWHEVIVELLKK